MREKRKEQKEQKKKRKGDGNEQIKRLPPPTKEKSSLFMQHFIVDIIDHGK